MLEQTSFDGGARWREGRESLDFSAALKVNKNVTLAFDAVNLTNEPVRTYWTSRIISLPDENGVQQIFDEGSIKDGAPKDRTLVEYVTGRIFRATFRVDF